MFRWIANLFRSKPAAAVPAVCKAKSNDCFGAPLASCNRGFCLIHCVCYCRGIEP